MYIATIPNRSSPPAILLRESYRQAGKVKSRTVTNLTRWPAEQVESFRRVLRGETLVSVHEALVVERTLPHGHTLAVLGTLRRLGLERVLHSRPSRQRTLVVAMIAARILDPRSKLATARGLDDETAIPVGIAALSSLGEELGLGDTDADELYEAMDWLLPRQAAIEKKLAKKHLQDGSLVLYDVSSSYFEGIKCPLAKRGHCRDGKKGKLQIACGLMCTTDGCPVAVEVFEGNPADPKTLACQIEKLRKRFGLTRLILVGDRGMLTSARIEEELRPIDGLDWISALRAPAIRKLAEDGLVAPSLFDQRDLAEITSPDFPGERLVACYNPLLAEKRARTRDELLATTEKELDKVVAATQRARNPLRGADKIGLRVGKKLGRYKVGKHFVVTITKDGFDYERNAEKIEAEAALDGIYVVRTSVEADTLGPDETVQAYKGLAVAERAFRSLKTVERHVPRGTLKVRPIHHRLADRVRAHVFLCMLAYYVEWHMREALAPILFDDDDKPAAQAARGSVVTPAQRSAKAKRKARTKRTEDDLPVHSFQTLLADLATLAKNQVRFGQDPGVTTTTLTQPTAVQQRALELLRIPLTGSAPDSTPAALPNP